MNPQTDNRLGITATVPTEVALAAGRDLLDLNNALITGTTPGEAVSEAELKGFPRNSCAWIKGIYTTIERLGLRELVGVIQGDCSNTEALLELLRDDGLRAVPFAYPASRKPAEMTAALNSFAETLGTTLSSAERWRKRLEPVRQDLNRLDELVVAGKRRDSAYFSLALSASDYGGDVDDYAQRLSDELARGEVPDKQPIRLAYLGVPPAFTNLLEQLDTLGASLVYAEIPHQFTMPFDSKNLTEQYLRYSYPYGMAFRVKEIERQLALRQADGVIHYVQSFCFRQIEDILLRRRVKLPLLTLEGDRPGTVNARDLLRLESFVESCLLSRNQLL